MSYPFLNQVLYGVSKSEVDRKYIEGLEKYMWVEGREMPQDETQLFEQKEVVESGLDLELPRETGLLPRETGLDNASITVVQKNTLFWSIFIAIHGYGEYLEASRKSGNREIEEKLKIVDALKQRPKVLKETNQKLTIEQTQALYGSLLTSREDRLDFCAAYAAFYQKTIWILYPKTYRVFSPTSESDMHEPIVLWATPGPKHSVIFRLCENTSELSKWIEERETVLKSQTHYKIGDLAHIGKKMGLDISEKPKKQELYDQIKSAIYKDMEFI